MNIISTWISAIIARLRNRKVYFWTHGLYGNESKLKYFFRILLYKIYNEIIKLLTLSKIECRPIVIWDFTQNPVMKFFDYRVLGGLPNSKKIHDNGFFVGNSHLDLSDELEYLATTLL